MGGLFMMDRQSHFDCEKLISALLAYKLTVTRFQNEMM